MLDFILIPILLGLAATTWAVRRLLARVSSARNIDGPPSASFLTGNSLQITAPDTGRDFQLRMAGLYGGVVKVKGLLGGHSLFVSDPKALHQILVKDQDVFEEWSAFTAMNSVVFGEGLIATVGDQHKKQRKMLNPVFSTKHLRGMTPTFFTIAKQLEQAILFKVDSGPTEINMIGWLTRTALELIGQSGLGHSFGDFSDGASNAFADAIQDVTPALSAMTPGAPFMPYLVKLGSPGLRRFLVKMTPWPLLQRLRQVVDIMAYNMLEIFQAQKGELNNSATDHEKGKDIMGILLKANKASLEEDRLSDSELLGQMATLISAATDTTSGALARILHLLAQHPDVQGRLRKEVVDAFRTHGEELDYDGISALPYLDAVIRETLRVFPPMPTVFRQACKDTVVPLLIPIRGVDGQDMHEIHVPAGTDVLVSILGANHHKGTWGEDAGDWKPERWLSPLPESVTANRHIAGVYSHMMTFLAGGRSCIGFKFSELEMKVVLATLLQSLEFSLPKNKKISWNVGLLMLPVVTGPQSTHNEMPLWVRNIAATGVSKESDKDITHGTE